MKIGIKHRLFLSILAATCLALFCMFLIMQWSINRGFLQYLNTLDQGRLEQITGNLGKAYSKHGSWDFLRENPRFLIMRLLNAKLDDSTSERLKGPDKGKDILPPPPPPEGAQQPRLPFIVLDAERNPLFGNPAEAKDINFRPIVHNNKTVGYIGLLPPKHFLNPHQEQFLKHQKSALILAAIGMVLVVVIISFPLANRLIRPIKAMAAATHDLASGKYSIRVTISSSDELGQLARDFNAMALTLEKNEKARRQWIADISHELRTPLAVLRGETEALLEGIRSTTPEAIHSLHAEVLRLHRLVEDLYQLALSDIGTLTYHKDELDLAEILTDSIEPYRAEFARKRIKFRADISQGLEFTVFADRERLQQLFTNLLDNSLKYTEAGGEIVIHFACHNGQAVIDFEDSAPGVPDEELDRLFDRLYRVEGSRSRATGGAGLGLTICRNIVEAHAGNITAHPSMLGGVLISVKLPLVRECL
jgi:two-component system sensor histidine kinase BaeS